MDHGHLWLLYNAVHEKAKSFSLNVCLLFAMHFKQKVRGFSHVDVSETLDVLLREANTNSPYLVHIYDGLFREVC